MNEIRSHLGSGSHVNEVSSQSFRIDKDGSDRKDQMQSSFLNYCRKDRVPIFIDLNSGEKTAGIIVGFDENTIVLEQNNSQCLFFKQNITCVRPKREVNYIFNEAYRSRNIYRSNSKIYS